MLNILSCDNGKMAIHAYNGHALVELLNDRKVLEPFLRKHKGWSLICEPTSTYHLELVTIARECGLTVYLVNPKEFRNYKDSVSFRAKTDRLDAEWLYQYLKRNQDKLRPWVPAPEAVSRLRNLIRVRCELVEKRVSLIQSVGNDGLRALDPLLEQFEKAIKAYDQEIDTLARGFTQYESLRSMVGVGPVSVAVLLVIFGTCPFTSAEAACAYVGLDPRARDSGQFRGRRRLSKRGDPLYRRVLSQAGRALLNSRLGRARNEDLKAKGRHSAERMVVAARKLLKVAFVIYSRNEPFQEEKWTWGLT